MRASVNARQKEKARAPLFAALGDERRLHLIAKLSAGGAPQSIAQLTEGTPVSRQAITKHLRVLEGVGLVRSVVRGRESLFALDARPLDEARRYLDAVSQQWDQALARLKAFVEE